MSESNSNGDCVRSLLYQSLQPYLFYWQLMCSAPYPVDSLQQNPGSVTRPKSYFKLARFLLTSLALSYVNYCSSNGVLELIDVPMPFFTGVLYVNEIFLGVLISLLTTVRSRCDPMHRVAETERHYLQLTACMELITRSYEFLIVVNTFAGINVTSLQLLEIYQHLRVNDANEVYITYNIVWIIMQLLILLMILYPCHVVKREQSRVGLMMFQLSQHGDARVESKIARFGILTLNRKDVAYTAHGILKLELSSLSGIIVALLSFMIILIQFDAANLNKHKGAITTMDSLYNSIQEE